MHIPGKENDLADAILRNNLSLFFTQVSQAVSRRLSATSATVNGLVANCSRTVCGRLSNINTACVPVRLHKVPKPKIFASSSILNLRSDRNNSGIIRGITFSSGSNSRYD